MTPLIETVTTKPNRITTTDKDTNPQYHSNYAKFCIGATNSVLHNEWVKKIYINKQFYKGEQWFVDEDIEGFLKDDTGQSRNRIEVVHNVVRPMVEQYRGNAIRMSINVTAKSMSIKSVNRRELKLGEQLFYTDMANEIDSYSLFLRKRYNVGKDKDETRQIFDNLYVDTYAEDVTELVREIARRNQFPSLQVPLAENLAFSGLGILEGFEYAGDLRYEVVPSEMFIWDRQSRRNDLQDSDFMGKLQYMLPTDVYEGWPDLGKENMDAIENYISSAQQRMSEFRIQGELSTRIPVYHIYWRDSDTYQYGYVMDEWNYPYLTRINFIYPGEDNPRYTDADLIAPPRSQRNDKLFRNGKKKRNLKVDTLRYCILIPSDILGQASSGADYSDVILDYGIYPYQDTELEDATNVKFPFKCQTWAYVDGEVLSPIDDVINPQRFINRIMSATESQINNSGGTNIVYDKDAVDAQDGEDEIMRNVAQGKPINLRTKGRGVPNTLGIYDATPKQGTYAMFNIIGTLKGLIQDTTGVNEALKGESTGSDQLVGVTEILLQRGSLMQEPFYYALSEIFMQAHQYTANVGKRIYIENERELAIMVGDDGVKVLKMSKGLKDEDFRVYVVRENVDSVLITQGNQELMTFKQLGMIDEKIFANLYGRSTPSDISRFLRQHSRDKIEAARIQAEQAKGQEQQIKADIMNEQQMQANVRSVENAQKFAAQNSLQDKKNEGALAATIAKSLGSGL